MTEQEALSKLRYRIGDPSPNEVEEITLREFFNSALERLAHDLEWNIPPAYTFTVAAQDYSVPLPDDLLWLLWLEVNGIRLQPDQVNRLILNQFSWSTQSPGQPSRYVIQARTLILIPPPGSDTQFTMSYIGRSPGLQPLGVTGLPTQDMKVAVYGAAAEWLAMFPGEDDAMMKKRDRLLKANLGYYQTELGNALERKDNPAKFAQKNLCIGGRRAFASR